MTPITSAVRSVFVCVFLMCMSVSFFGVCVCVCFCLCVFLYLCVCFLCVCVFSLCVCLCLFLCVCMYVLLLESICLDLTFERMHSQRNTWAIRSLKLSPPPCAVLLVDISSG